MLLSRIQILCNFFLTSLVDDFECVEKSFSGRRTGPSVRPPSSLVPTPAGDSLSDGGNGGRRTKERRTNKLFLTLAGASITSFANGGRGGKNFRRIETDLQKRERNVRNVLAFADSKEVALGILQICFAFSAKKE